MLSFGYCNHFFVGLFRMRKTSISIENGIQSSEPPTPPPPLLIDDLMPRKRFESLDEIFEFEKNILFGRETTL